MLLPLSVWKENTVDAVDPSRFTLTLQAHNRRDKSVGRNQSCGRCLLGLLENSVFASHVIHQLVLEVLIQSWLSRLQLPGFAKDRIEPKPLET